MARSYAKVYISIWAGDFSTLSIGAQGLYFRLLTDAKLSMCGVVDWRPNRLVHSFAGMTVGALRNLATELETAGYVVIDDDTEEALIRSFVRHDGVLKSPNLTTAMATDWLAIASPRIKDVVVAEVRRTLAEEPNAKGSRSVPDWFPKGFQIGSRSAPEEVPIGSADPTGEPFPNSSPTVPAEFPDPATCNQQPTNTLVAEASNVPKRAQRIPDDYAPTKDLTTWGQNEYPWLDLEAVTASFVDYWQAESGTKANKLDWHRTWRVWVRREADRTPDWKRQQRQSPTDTDTWDHLKIPQDLIDREAAR